MNLGLFFLQQSGFKPFKAYDDNLTVLTTYHCDFSARTGFLNRTPTVVVFLDIAGAFDNVDPHIFVADLFEIGIPAPLRKFVENFISNRQLSFVIERELYGPYTSLKEILQEFILSALFFYVYLRALDQQLHLNIRLL